MVGESDDAKEVVTYTLGPRHVAFDVWEPKEYVQVGTEVEVMVEASVYMGRAQFRIAQEEEF